MTTCNRLVSLADESFLLTWFIENYVRKCSQYCPENVSILLEDISTSDKLEHAVHAIVDWKLRTLAIELYENHYDWEKMVFAIIRSFRDDAKFTQTIVKEIKKISNQESEISSLLLPVCVLRTQYQCTPCIRTFSIHYGLFSIHLLLQLMMSPSAAVNLEHFSPLERQ